MQIIQFGYGRLGQRVTNNLSSAQHAIDVYRFSNTTAEHATNTLQCDISKPFNIEEEDKLYDVAVVILSPKSLSVEDYRDVFVHGVDNILSALNTLAQPVKHLFIVSSTRVFPQQSDDFLDEHSDTFAWDEKAGILIEMEKKIAACNIPSSIIRLTGLYGASTRMVGIAKKVANTKTWPAKKWTNRIHIDDAVLILSTLCETAFEGKQNLQPVYNGVDNSCVTNHEVIEFIAQQHGFSLPHNPLESAEPTGKKVKSLFINNIISLNYPSYQEGYYNEKV